MENWVDLFLWTEKTGVIENYTLLLSSLFRLFIQNTNLLRSLNVTSRNVYSRINAHLRILFVSKKSIRFSRHASLPFINRLRRAHDYFVFSWIQSHLSPSALCGLYNKFRSSYLLFQKLYLSLRLLWIFCTLCLDDAECIGKSVVHPVRAFSRVCCIEKFVTESSVVRLVTFSREWKIMSS